MRKIKHSFACYKNAKGETIGRVKECAEKLINWGEIPARLNDFRAMEIAMVAKDYLRLRALAHKRLGTRK